MSIIEKAAGKIGAGAAHPPPQGGPGDSSHDAGLIENALNKQRSSQPGRTLRRHPGRPHIQFA